MMASESTERKIEFLIQPKSQEYDNREEEEHIVDILYNNFPVATQNLKKSHLKHILSSEYGMDIDPNTILKSPKFTVRVKCRDENKLRMLDDDWKNGNLKKSIMVVLCQQQSFRKYRNIWEITPVVLRLNANTEIEMGHVKCDTDHGEDRNMRLLYGILRTYICDKSYSDTDLFRLINEYMGKGNPIHELRGTNDGMTLLHVSVCHNRWEFMKVFYETGILSLTCNLRVNNTKSEYYGRKASEIIIKGFKGKSSNAQCLRELEKYMKYDEALPPICKYARDGNLKALRDEIDKKPQEIISSEDGTWPLWWAVTKGSSEIINILCEGKISHEGMAILHRAVELGHHHLIGQLVELGCPMTSNVIHYAAKGDQRKCIEKLLNEYSEKIDVNSKDFFNRTPLMLAVDNNATHSIKYLLEKGSRVNNCDKRGRNVFHYAANNYVKLESYQLLIEAARKERCLVNLLNQKELYLGADQCMLIKGRDKGEHAWYYVIVDRALKSLFANLPKGNLDVGKYGPIIKSGWGMYPSQEAIDEIARKYNPTKLADGVLQWDLTPLHYAVLRNYPEMAISMLKNGADITMQNIDGLSSLHLGAMIGMIELFIELGNDYVANYDTLDKKGRSALFIAECNNQTKIVNYINATEAIEACEKLVSETLINTLVTLNTHKLHKLRSVGGDVKGLVVQHLRDLESDIHDVLYKMSTTPILQPVSQ